MLTRRARRFPNSLRSESKCSASIDELRSRVLCFASRCYTRCGSSPHVNLILRVHAPHFYFLFFLVVTRITLSLFYFCEIIFASRFSAMRLSSHRSHTSSRFESLIAQINFYFILSRRSVRSRLCGSRSHGSPHELALRSLDDLFMSPPRFRFTRSALRSIFSGLRLSVDFAPSAPHLTSKVSQFQDSC